MQKHKIKSKDLLKIYLNLPNRLNHWSDGRVEINLGLQETTRSDIVPRVCQSVQGYFEWNNQTGDWDLVIEL